MLFALFSAQSFAGEGSIGNGGGSWVCREKNGKIRWSELVDLFEARHEYDDETIQSSEKYPKIVAQIQERLTQIDPKLSRQMEYAFERVQVLAHQPPSIKHTTDTLEFVDDSLYRLRPAPSRCKQGVLNYEQVVNFKNDGMILVQKDVFKSLPEVSKAALVVHEAVYLHRREYLGDQTSVNTRRIVGLLFSQLDINEQAIEISKLSRNDHPKERVFSDDGSDFVFISHGMISNKDRSVYHIVGDFEIQSTEVTQLQWFQVMQSNPSTFSSEKDCPRDWIMIAGVGICPRNPVENVSMHDVRKFIGQLNRAQDDGFVYGLPGEYQWEYAARAGATTSFSFGDVGDQYEQLRSYAWGKPFSKGVTHPVRSRFPNAWKLFDMTGNVKEWVDGDCNVRGGSYNSSMDELRLAYRERYSPNTRSSEIGFRLVRSPGMFVELDY